MEIRIDTIKYMNSKNISDDKDTTIDACKVWYTLKKKEKEKILEIAGVSKYAIYKTISDGKISVRVALAFAITLDVSPFSLVEKNAKKEEKCTAELCNNFIKKYLKSNKKYFADNVLNDKELVLKNGKIEQQVCNLLSDVVLMENAKLVTNEQLISLLQASFIKLEIEGKDSEELLYIKALALKGL